jgi:UDP-N-acetylmuramate--alanine ligase
VVSAMPHPSARYIGSLEDIRQYLIKYLESGDILLVLSAGDADQVSADVLAVLQER